jgi:hypothetical protein
LQRDRLRSQRLGRDIAFSHYLPDLDARTPEPALVRYLLHGDGDNEETWTGEDPVLQGPLVRRCATAPASAPLDEVMPRIKARLPFTAHRTRRADRPRWRISTPAAAEPSPSGALRCRRARRAAARALRPSKQKDTLCCHKPKNRSHYLGDGVRRLLTRRVGRRRRHANGTNHASMATPADAARVAFALHARR